MSGEGDDTRRMGRAGVLYSVCLSACWPGWSLQGRMWNGQSHWNVPTTHQDCSGGVLKRVVEDAGRRGRVSFENGGCRETFMKPWMKGYEGKKVPPHLS